MGTCSACMLVAADLKHQQQQQQQQHNTDTVSQQQATLMAQCH
jgi:hypothetical protein